MEGSVTTKVDQTRTPTQDSAKKKPYSPPVIQKWGNLKDLTQSNGWSGNKDGGKGKQQRRTR
jgi:hypothetical protein